MIKIMGMVMLGLTFIMGGITPNDNKTKKEKSYGINLDNLDKDVSPREDFYNFVNGGWLANNKIPEDHSSWGSFNEVRKYNNQVTLKVLKDAMKNEKYKEGTDQYKAMLFFNTAMNTTEIDKQGYQPLKPYLDKVNKVTNIKELQDLLAELLPYGMSQLFGYGIAPNLVNSNINSAYIGASSLGLPERSYYVDKDKDTVEKRKAYVKHIAKMFDLVQIPDGKSRAKRIIDLETKLATAMLTKEKKRNPSNLYNPMTVDQLQKLTPAINWNSYFTKLNTGKIDEIIVTEPKYMEAVQQVLATVPLSTIKELISWNIINVSAEKLGKQLEYADFDFYSKILNGVDKMRPREERVLSVTNNALGEAVGKLYVEKVFPPEAKKKAKAMVNNILAAFKERIDKLAWMSDTTKAKAHLKLDNFTVKIGYPDKWKDYSKLKIQDFADGGSYLQNSLNVYKWLFEEKKAELGQPVDKTKWGMAPQTVNAYFNPLNNEIVFPAAILQPPFYDYRADDAVNYGGIGAVIGHEISHGFDDSGSRFDEKGNLNNWWTDQDKEKFTALGKKLVAQFDKIYPFPDVHLNGTFTLGENIGDLGGVSVAYTALQNHLKKVGRPKNIDGFTPEQRFFISWATIWRTKMREEALRNRIKTDPHTPGMYRAIEPLKNVNAFYEAFGINKGDKDYIQPKDRIKIW